MLGFLAKVISLLPQVRVRWILKELVDLCGDLKFYLCRAIVGNRTGRRWYTRSRVSIGGSLILIEELAMLNFLEPAWWDLARLVSEVLVLVLAWTSHLRTLGDFGAGRSLLFW